MCNRILNNPKYRCFQYYDLEELNSTHLALVRKQKHTLFITYNHTFLISKKTQVWRTREKHVPSSFYLVKSEMHDEKLYFVLNEEKNCQSFFQLVFFRKHTFSGFICRSKGIFLLLRSFCTALPSNPFSHFVLL